MPDLSKCNFSGSYDTNFESGIVKNFYVPLLSNSISFDRMSGFFTSNSLSIAARGIINLIQNGGKMRILTSPVLSQEDASVLSDYYDNPDKLSERLDLIIQQSMTEDFFQSESTEALGWMLLNGFLEIRLVVVIEDKKIIPLSSAESIGIFHNKVGIARDDLGNIVTFSGSINETAGGWINNIESFDVFCSWEAGSLKHIQPHIDRFEHYWQYGISGRSLTIDFPEASQRKWIKHVPNDRDKLKIYRSQKNGIELRDYQLKAIQSWVSNSYHGIFNMATGTGKTLTAIYAVRELVEKVCSRYVLIVAVPFQHLIDDPWVQDLSKHLVSSSKSVIIPVFSGNTKWSVQLSDAKVDYKLKLLDSIVIVSTYDSLSGERFERLIKDIATEVIFVADEVHNAGADTYRLSLNEKYPYRLGLSATPARYLDEDGTNFIQNYFSGEIFSFDLSCAINTINPDTGASYLTPYYYYPIIITLTEKEICEYEDYSRKIAKMIKDDPTPQEIARRNSLLIQRSRIIKNAKNKLIMFNNKVKEFVDKDVFDYCLIYCSDGKDEETSERTLTSVISTLNKEKVECRRFTSDDSFADRATILDEFASGELSTLVAIKCLDEGVDVPATKNAIIMASTGNPREYIQRRGRILRPFPGKQFATLYDYIVVPGDLPGHEQSELQILRNEYARFKEFSDLSLNRDENRELLQSSLIANGISLDQLERDEDVEIC